MNETFHRAAGDILQPLLSTHGFHLTVAVPATIMYQSTVCILIFSHDAERSFEVNLGLLQIGSKRQPPYSLDEIFRAQEVPLPDLPSGYAVTSPEAMRPLVAQITKLLGSYAGELLDGKEEAWRRLESKRSTDSFEYATALCLEDAKIAATAAWSARDYTAVIAALQPVSPLLGKAELAKLAYSRRHLFKTQ